MDYQILEANSESQLRREVLEAIGKGWTLYGSPFSSGGSKNTKLHQAMTNVSYTPRVDRYVDYDYTY